MSSTTLHKHKKVCLSLVTKKSTGGLAVNLVVEVVEAVKRL